MPNDKPAINHSIPGPDKLTFEGKPEVNFKKFKRAWKTFETGSRIKDQEPVVRASCLQAYLKEDVQEILEGLPFDQDEDRKKADKILEVLEKYCVGEVNETYERYAFFTRNQKSGERLDAYIGALRVLNLAILLHWRNLSSVTKS